MRGFVHRDTTDGSWLSWGPGAEGLLSEAFLDAHCFRTVESRDEPGLVALSFEPIGVPKVTGNSGMWIISSWVLRSPVMDGRRLLGITEGGREVIAAFLPDGRRIR